MSGGVLGLEAPAVEAVPSKLPLFTENPRRVILGNWASGTVHSQHMYSQKLSFMDIESFLLATRNQYRVAPQLLC
jgi:hypothetical protein